MKQYLVISSDANGDNLDLFVTARNPEQAWSLWQSYYELEHSEMDPKNISVREVPIMTREPSTHTWENIMNHILDRTTGLDVDASRK